MNVYLAGTAVKLAVPLEDSVGNVTAATAVAYRVVDQDGIELVARTQVDGAVAPIAEVQLTIPAEANAAPLIPENMTESQVGVYTTTRALRTVELFLTLEDGNEALLLHSYAIEPTNAVMVGLNSFQSLDQAELKAMEIPGLTGWADASRQEKIAALIEARHRISQLGFSLDNASWGQSSLNYAAGATSDRLFMFDGRLDLLTPSQFKALPARFRAALCVAQVSEADQVLGGGSSADARRQDGVMLETIGEVKKMFRSSKPLDMPVSKRTLRYLGTFISFSKRITRT